MLVVGSGEYVVMGGGEYVYGFDHHGDVVVGSMGSTNDDDRYAVVGGFGVVLISF